MALAENSYAPGASPAVRAGTVPPLPRLRAAGAWTRTTSRRTSPRPSDGLACVPAGRAPPGSALSGSPLLSPARPQRHGLAVCLALTTMCTSLLLLYSSLGGQKERPPQQQQPQQQHQPQATATGSAQPSAESSSASRPGAPTGPRPLDGYLGVADHKVTAGSPTRTLPTSLGIPHS